MIDTDTLYITSAVSRAAFLVIFMATVLSQPTERYLWHWITALVTSTLGSSLMFIFGVQAEMPVLIRGTIYVLFLASLVFSWSGIRLFHSRRTHYSYLLLLTLVPSLFFTATIVLGASLRVMLAFIYLFSALLAGLATYEILKPPRERLLSQYVVAFAFTCYCLVLLIPALGLIFGIVAPEMLTSGHEALLLDQVMAILVYFGYIAMASERANLRLKQLAETDPLTGLANRRGMNQINDNNISSQGTSVIIGDLDHFKRINDELGHEGGDIVLKDVGMRLGRITRNNDVAMRWGGEEFLVVLPNTELQQALIIAERLRRLIEDEPFIVDKSSVKVTISLGVSEIQAEESGFDAAIDRADKALYDAKKGGRNRVCQYRPKMV